MEALRAETWWLGWLFAIGFFFSALGLVASVVRFRAEGSVTLGDAFFAAGCLFFGSCVVGWLTPRRPKPRIVPCFARQIERYGGETSKAFPRGRGLYLEIAALDDLAATLGVRPLSAFGFADEYYGQEVLWHPASEGLHTVDALRKAPGVSALAAPGVPQDLEALASVLRVAAERGVDFSLALRLHEKDSLQGVMTREARQGRFW